MRVLSRVDQNINIMNNDNLRNLTTSEAREIGRKGGKASVAARKQKRTMREAMRYAMNGMELSSETRKKLEAAGIDPKDFTHTIAVTLALIEKAEAGDVSAYNAIRDILGEKPKDEASVEIPKCVKIHIVEGARTTFAHSEDEIER